MANFRTAAACSLCLASAGHAEEVLDLASAFQGDVPIVGEQGSRFVDIFNSISSDTKFRFHGPGALVPVSQSLETVSDGYVDATFSLAGYWEGRLPAAALFTAFPFGFDTQCRMSWLYEGNGLALYQELYDRAGYDVVVVPCGVTPAEISGWFKTEITSPEDLDGLRMRAFGFGAEVYGRLGVKSELLFADEIPFALGYGALDAAEFSVLAADVYLGLHDHTDYVYFPGWHQPSTLFELLVNKDVWNRMSDQNRAAVKTACEANILQNFANAKVANLQALDEIVAQGAVEVRTWSPEMLAAFEAAWMEIVEDRVKGDRFFRKVWEDIEAFRSEWDEWTSVSTLRCQTAGR